MSKEYNPRFFYPNGDPINDIKQFICYYNERYYTYPKSDDYKVQYFVNGKPRSVGKTSGCAEKIIENILQKKKYTNSDVIVILAWKIGKITHSESIRKIVLHKDWKKQVGDWTNGHFSGLEEGDVPCKINRYGKNRKIVIPICVIRNYLNNIIGPLANKDDILGELDNLLKEEWSGIGPVYKITLLYFKSKGKCPIYDQFAWRALKAIKDGINPKANPEKEQWPNIDAPDITDEKAHDILSEYIDMIEEIEKYKKTKEKAGIKRELEDKGRSLDRALWVYGHLFKQSGKK